MSHSIFSRILCATVLMGSLVPGLAQAQSEIFQAMSLKHNEQAARGCIARVDLKTAQQTMKRFNLTSEGATEQEVRALGTALVWIEQLHAGKPHEMARGDASDPYAFKFTGGSGSRQTVHNIVIGRSGEHKFGENVAQLVHELGHYVGNNGAYEEYFAATKNQYCVISGYSDDRRNEQFAEAFATFVTRPSMMKNNKSAACQRAYHFFAKKFFANGELAEKCLDGKVDELEFASLQNQPKRTNSVSTTATTAASAAATKAAITAAASSTASAPTVSRVSAVSVAPVQVPAPSSAPLHNSANNKPSELPAGRPSDRPSELPPGLESASEFARGI